MPRRNKNKNMENYTLNVASVEKKLQKEKKKEILQQMANTLKEATKKEEDKTLQNETQEKTKANVAPKATSPTVSQDYTKIDTHCDYLNKAEDVIEEVAKLFNSLEFDADYLDSVISTCQEEQNDLLHEIELSKDFSEDRIVFLYKELHNCRTKRRNYKDLRERITPINNFYKKNKSVLQAILSVKKEMEKVRRNKRKPVYIPRVRTDLTI